MPMLLTGKINDNINPETGIVVLGYHNSAINNDKNGKGVHKTQGKNKIHSIFWYMHSIHHTKYTYIKTFLIRSKRNYTTQKVGTHRMHKRTHQVLRHGMIN